MPILEQDMFKQSVEFSISILNTCDFKSKSEDNLHDIICLIGGLNESRNTALIDALFQHSNFVSIVERHLPKAELVEPGHDTIPNPYLSSVVYHCPLFRTRLDESEIQEFNGRG